jgi:predicted nucleic acid-binding protein
MSQACTVVFDNEAIDALTDVRHRKHRWVLAVVEAVAARNVRRAGSVRLVIPSTVRVEAGWDRHTPNSAAVNRLRIHDAPLDTEVANRAARIRAALAVSVADAHLAATLETTPAPHAVLTSDPDDIQRIAEHLGVRPHVVIV